MLKDELDQSVRSWMERYQRLITSSSITYKGVPIWKNVLDLWIYQEIIHETRPEIIIELGCKFGGSAIWLADILQTFGSGKVVTVDILPRPEALPAHVAHIQGDSISAAVVDQIASLCGDRRAMVIADSNHAADHVLHEIRLYSPFVPIGGYFIVEDGVVDVLDWKRFTPGPEVATARFLAENQQFVVDTSRERFGITYNPQGFLRRVK